MKSPLILNLKINRLFTAKTPMEGAVRYYLDMDQLNSISFGSSPQSAIFIPNTSQNHFLIHIMDKFFLIEAIETVKVVHGESTKHIPSGKKVKAAISALQSKPVSIKINDSEISFSFKRDIDILSQTQLDYMQSKFGHLTKVGQGGVSLVYKTEDKEPLAFKILLPSLAKDQRIVNRFVSSSNISKKFSHPSLITSKETYSYPEHKLYFTVMEYFPGEHLQNLLGRQGILQFKQALYITKNIAEAVAFLHKEGHLHRNLSYRNVLVSQKGDVKLIGLSLIKNPDMDLTQDGTTMLSPNFTAPEQILQLGGIDERADVFSLGALLYTMLFGKPPFDAKNPKDYQKMASNLPPPTFPDTFAHEIPYSLIDLISSTLSSDRNKRAKDAGEWVQLFSEASEPSDKRSLRKDPLDFSASSICSTWDLFYGNYQLDVLNLDSDVQDDEKREEKESKKGTAISLSKHFIDDKTLEVKGRINLEKQRYTNITMEVVKEGTSIHPPLDIPDPLRISSVFKNVPKGPCTIILRSNNEEIYREDCRTEAKLEKTCILPDGDLLVSGKLTVLDKGQPELRLLDEECETLTSAPLSYSEDIYKIFVGQVLADNKWVPYSVQVISNNKVLDMAMIIRVSLDTPQWVSSKTLRVSGKAMGVDSSKKVDILVNNSLRATPEVMVDGSFEANIDVDFTDRYKIAVRVASEILAKTVIPGKLLCMERFKTLTWVSGILIAFFVFMLITRCMFPSSRSSNKPEPLVKNPDSGQKNDVPDKSTPNSSSKVLLTLNNPYYSDLGQKMLYISGSAPTKSVKLILRDYEGSRVKEETIPVEGDFFSCQISVPEWKSYKIEIQTEEGNLTPVTRTIDVPSEVENVRKILKEIVLYDIPAATRALESSVTLLLKDKDKESYLKRSSAWEESFSALKAKVPENDFEQFQILNLIKNSLKNIEELQDSIHQYILLGAWMETAGITTFLDVVNSRHGATNSLEDLKKNYRMLGGNSKSLFEFSRD